MSYGRLSEEQTRALRPHVEGKFVHDMGAGTCELSLELLGLGASRVIALDSKKLRVVEHTRLDQVQSTFEDAVSTKSVDGRFGEEEIKRARKFVREIDVAFLSWPANYDQPGLIELVRRARIVVYLGKNTDGTACGWPGLFRFELLRRPVLTHVPDRPNTLIVYGRKTQEERPLLGEELAALAAYDVPPRFLTWADAVKHDASVKRQV